MNERNNSHQSYFNDRRRKSHTKEYENQRKTLFNSDNKKTYLFIYFFYHLRLHFLVLFDTQENTILIFFSFNFSFRFESFSYVIHCIPRNIYKTNISPKNVFVNFFSWFPFVFQLYEHEFILSSLQLFVDLVCLASFLTIENLQKSSVYYHDCI